MIEARTINTYYTTGLNRTNDHHHQGILFCSSCRIPNKLRGTIDPSMASSFGKPVTMMTSQEMRGVIKPNVRDLADDEKSIKTVWLRSKSRENKNIWVMDPSLLNLSYQFDRLHFSSLFWHSFACVCRIVLFKLAGHEGHHALGESPRTRRNKILERKKKKKRIRFGRGDGVRALFKYRRRHSTISHQ